MHQPKSSPAQKSEATRMTLSQPSSWLSLPAPIRIMFDRFPITTYDENPLPQRVPTSRSANVLYIFTLHNESLSPNPACLRWQLYLQIHKIPFSICSSSNHASPTGALPFLLPAWKSKREPRPQAITSSKLQRWSETQGAREEKENLKLEAFTSLIDQNIRNAWLYHLYLEPSNFDSVATRLYVEPASSNYLVRIALARQLQNAAMDQLLRTRSFIDSEEIYEQADAAFEALSTLLGDQDFFSGEESPSLFDASLVAYTHLILDFENSARQSGVQWKNCTLSRILSRHVRLVEHRHRVLRFCGTG